MSDTATTSRTEPPAIDEPADDLSGDEMPAERTVPNPTLYDTIRAWLVLALPAIVVNLLIYVVADSAGTVFEADLGNTVASIDAISIAVVTAGTLLSSTVVWAAVAHRAPGFAELWVPIGWGVGLVSLALIIGVSGLGAAIALGAMHIITTFVAAHLIPRALPRQG